MLPIYILLGAWSISIRPYYILVVLAAITWPGARELVSGNESTNKFQFIGTSGFNKNAITVALRRVTLLGAFIVTINILPYILTGEGKALVDAFIINRISITPENHAGIIDIFFMATTKAPLIVLPLIVSNA